MDAIEQGQLYTQEMDAYKRMAEQRKKRRSLPQEEIYAVYQKVGMYIQEMADKEKPLTISGMTLASGKTTEVWKKANNGSYDHYLEEFIKAHGDRIDGYVCDMPYVEIENEQLADKYSGLDGYGKGKVTVLLEPISVVLEKARLMLEEQTETRLYEKGRVGDIFALKSKHGWRDDKSPDTVNQTLVISTDEAKKALELLK